MSKPIDKDTQDKIIRAIKAHKGVAILGEIASHTGLRPRVVHNLTWRMEGAPRGGVPAHREEMVIARAQTTGRTVSYRVLAKGESTYTPAPKFETAKYATKSSLED